MFLMIWRKLIYVNYLPISSDCFFSNHCCMLCCFSYFIFSFLVAKTNRISIAFRLFTIKEATVSQKFPFSFSCFSSIFILFHVTSESFFLRSKTAVVLPLIHFTILNIVLIILYCIIIIRASGLLNKHIFQNCLLIDILCTLC